MGGEGESAISPESVGLGMLSDVAAAEGAEAFSRIEGVVELML